MLQPRQTIIGMIHVDALPGTPKYKGSVGDIAAKARWEAAIYADNGVDAIAIENMHDIPYLNREVGPEIVAAMTLIAHEVKQSSGLPCGIQILAGANQAALAAAKAADLDFVRAEGFAFAHVADEGLMQADAGPLLRYRRAIDAVHIPIWADIKKKHSAHAITGDVSIAETAKAASFFGADGVIVTGASTGYSASVEELRQVKEAVDIPVMVGSGLTRENLGDYLSVADGLIVGSWFKKNGRWDQEVDPNRVSGFMEKVRSLRS